MARLDQPWPINSRTAAIVSASMPQTPKQKTRTLPHDLSYVLRRPGFGCCLDRVFLTPLVKHLWLGLSNSGRQCPAAPRSRFLVPWVQLGPETACRVAPL